PATLPAASEPSRPIGHPSGGASTSRVLAVRVDGALFERLHRHAARRGMTIQDYVAGMLVREDFDERLLTSVESVERLVIGGTGAEVPPLAG
ncbi:hypothetical protein, partial [Streptomyces calidiresistens]|uniref:hypothetical protein n=1 Tax=Streptomyces calidiresistens TaxID=1485586 RepID=UPI002B21EC41